jgi:cyclic-di-GMP-binding protein
MPTFDIVSQVDTQEVRNAVDQASRELVNRYDFKGTDTSVVLNEDGIVVDSSTEERLKAAVEVVKEKIIKRKVSLKSLAGGEPTPVGGGRYRATFTLATGIDADSARELSKFIRGMATKVQASINGDVVRVTGKKRDDLQAVIAEVKGLNFKLPLQYVNFRD